MTDIMIDWDRNKILCEACYEDITNPNWNYCPWCGFPRVHKYYTVAATTLTDKTNDNEA